MATVIKISQSAVALLRGMGKDLPTMAAKFKITEKEMRDVLEDFGMLKSRAKKVVEPAYVIELEYDMNEIEEAESLEKVSEELVAEAQ